MYASACSPRNFSVGCIPLEGNALRVVGCNHSVPARAAQGLVQIAYMEPRNLADGAAGGNFARTTRAARSKVMGAVRETVRAGASSFFPNEVVAASKTFAT